MSGPESFGSDRDVRKTPKQTFVFEDELEIDESNQGSPETDRSVDKDVVSIREEAEEGLQGKIEVSKEVSNQIKDLTLEYKNNLGEENLGKPFDIEDEKRLAEVIPEEEIRVRVIMKLKDQEGLEGKDVVMAAVLEKMLLSYNKKKEELTGDVNSYTPSRLLEEGVDSEAVKTKLAQKEATFGLFQELGLLKKGTYDPGKPLNFELAFSNLNTAIEKGEITLKDFITKYAEVLDEDPKQTMQNFINFYPDFKKFGGIALMQDRATDQGKLGDMHDAVASGNLGDFYSEYACGFAAECPFLDKAVAEATVKIGTEEHTAEPSEKEPEFVVQENAAIVEGDREK